MAVKDVNTNKGSSSPAQVGLKPAKPLTLNSLPNLQTTLKTDAVSISQVEGRPTQQQQQVRQKLNRAIEAANVATGAVADLHNILGGIEGILEQVSAPNVPAPRVAILEREAKGLRDELAKTAQAATSDGVKPLAGDSIRVELEETLGKALEIVLPDDAQHAFGINNINFSKRDLILDTVAKVEEARRGVAKLRERLEQGVGTLHTTIAALDIANENAEAAQTSVRDVDQAVKLARNTRSDIRQDPSGALNSLGDIGKKATDLLGG